MPDRAISIIAAFIIIFALPVDKEIVDIRDAAKNINTYIEAMQRGINLML